MIFTLENFIFPSVLMGLGIAIDVLIATVSRFNDEKMSFVNWTLPVALAHIFLPALGYYGWWFLGLYFNEFALILGLLAFAMVTTFIYEAICEWVNTDPVVSLSPITDRLFAAFSSESKGRVMMILAVSMDALWSGPAKAAQAESGQWTTFEVLISFLVAGAVVALISELSLLIAFKLRNISFSNTKILALYLVIGKYLEATILFSFGLLSLWNGFSFWVGIGSLSECIMLSAVFMLVVWITYWKRLFNQQLNELDDA